MEEEVYAFCKCGSGVIKFSTILARTREDETHRTYCGDCGITTKEFRGRDGFLKADKAWNAGKTTPALEE